MRWYCVLCLRASVLKKSTLRLLNAMVTLTPSSLKTRSSGRGRKSGTTLGFPRGSSVYLIFPLIYPLAFPPVAGAKNPNDIVAIGKPDCENDPAFDLAETVEPLFTGTVRRILGNDADGIGEGPLRLGERHAVLCLVILVLAGVPIEPGFRHGERLARIWRSSHTFVWLSCGGLCDLATRPCERGLQIRPAQDLHGYTRTARRHSLTDSRSGYSSPGAGPEANAGKRGCRPHPCP